MSTRLVALTLVLAVSGGLRAAAPPAHPLPSRIDAWVVQLGDEDFDKRREASARLRAAGVYAEAALEKALASPDAEVKRRARAILGPFRRGIYPDTPAAVVELITTYETAAASEKAPVIRRLIDSGPAGCRALVKLARAEKDALTRKEVFAAVFNQLSKAVPALIESGDTASIEGILELALQGEVSNGAAHFAAYHLLRGTLPGQIARLRREAKGKAVAKAEHETLAYLYRASGDLKRALLAAKEAERNDLVESLLYESGDWKALNERPDLIDPGHRPRKLGLQAAYARLCGDEKTHLAAVKGVLDLAKAVEETKGDLYPVAKALWFNGRPDEALGLFKKRDTAIRLQYELMAARFQFRDAFALADDAVKNAYADHQAVELAHARTLHLLGEKEKARAIVVKYTGLIEKNTQANWLPEVVATELALDRRDEAFAAAARILSLVNDAAVSARLFDKLFGDDAEEAASLWVLSRRPPGKLEHPAAMSRVRDLMAGRGTKENIKTLITAANNEPPNTRGEEQSAHWLAAGNAALRCGQADLAADCFRDAKSLRAAIRLGDIEAGKKEWLKASILYHQAFRLGLKPKEKPQPDLDGHRENQPALALFLYGHALVNAGMEEAGRRRIEQAHLLPLADAARRYDLMRDLRRRGHREASAREQVYLRRLGEPLLREPDSFHTAEGFRYGAIDALARGQYLKAADGFEQSFLRVLHPELNFGRNTAYAQVPAMLFTLRALALAQSGKYEEALRESKRCESAMPGHLPLTERLVPLLEARGRKKDADAVYRATRKTYERIAGDYPKSALMHNQLGWLSAACKRDLGKGLASARRAVELAPKSAAFHDTLAEVLFQLGKKDDAIAAQRNAVRLDPKRAYFRRQLKRIEAGDPKAARPTDEE